MTHTEFQIQFLKLIAEAMKSRLSYETVTSITAEVLSEWQDKENHEETTIFPEIERLRTENARLRELLREIGEDRIGDNAYTWDADEKLRARIKAALEDN